MSKDQLVYFVFGAVILIALILDLGFLSKKCHYYHEAGLASNFLGIISACFFVFMWVEEGQKLGFEYLSGYLMEWSLSIDNIFVFILIFNSFKVKEKHIPRVLLIGILAAILFRVIFITVGVALVAKFAWVLYIFGVFLVYTGYKMFYADDEDNFDPHHSKIYLFLKNSYLLAIPMAMVNLSSKTITINLCIQAYLW